MDVSIVHPSLNRAGGAERYCLEMIDILASSGHQVSLYTIDKTDWEQIQRTQGKTVEPIQEIYIQQEPLEPDGVLSWILTGLRYVMLLIRATEESDICINNYGEVLPFFTTISVIHSVPMSTSTVNSYELPFWGLMRRLYMGIYDRLQKRYSSEIIVTNSGFNAERIDHDNIEVIYPQVELPNLSPVEKNGEILTVSRLKLSKSLRCARSERLINELRRFKNVEVYSNPSRETILGLMNQSSVYLSTQEDEAFGMAIIEAMSLDCIPVVYRGGGPWLDIFNKKEEIGLTYGFNREAVEAINRILGDDELRDLFRVNGRIRASSYSKEIFRAHFQELIASLRPMEKRDTRLFRSYRWLREQRNRLKRPRIKLSVTWEPLLRH